MVIQKKSANFIILLLVLFSGWGCANKKSKQPPVAKDGVIDLSKWDFDKDGPVNLRGEWRFAWQEFVKPLPVDEMLVKYPNKIQSSSFWNTKKHPDQSGNMLPGIGYASYMLQLRLPPKVIDQLDQMEFNYFTSGPAKMEVWTADGQTILSKSNQGIPARHAKAEKPIQITTTSSLAKAQTDSLLLIFHLSNHHLARGGMINTLNFGHKKSIERDKITNLGISLILIGALIITSIYHLILYIQRPADQSSLAFCLFCGVMACREVIMIRLVQTLGISDGITGFDYLYRIEYITLTLGPTTCALFIKQMVPGRLINLIFNLWMIGLGSLLILLTLVTSTLTFSSFLTFYQIHIMVGGIIVLTHLVIKSFQHSKDQKVAQMISLSLLILLAGAINDILNTNNIISTGHYIVYTFMGFILIQSTIISGKFAEAFKKSEHLSQNLKEEVKLQTIELQQKTNIAIIAKEESEQAHQETMAAKEESEAAHKEAHSLRLKAEEQADKLKELDMEKTSFFRNISHELRTPLTLILSPLENLLRETPDNKNATIAAKNSRRLLRLVNQLLEFQKLEAGKKDIKLSTINLTHFIYLSGDYFATACSDKGIDFIMTINDEPMTPDSHPLWVKGEIDALEKIVFNYLSNALKYTPAGGLIELGLKANEDRIKIYVTDSGAGISEENQEKLFKVFSRVDESTNRNYEGTGLGLALVKSLADEMDGKVGITSELDEGSTFWVDFNRVFVKKSADNHHSTTINQSVIDLLVVDDDEHLLNLLINNLPDQLGIEIENVAGVTSVKACIDFFEETQVRCLLSDYNLGNSGNGLDLLTEIGQKHPATKKVLMTAEANLELVQKVVNECAIDQVFYKPLDQEKLIASLRALITASSIEDPSDNDETLKIKPWVLSEDNASLDEEQTDDFSVIQGDGKGELILVVDDIPEMRELIASTLKQRSYRVALAPEGEKALNIAQSIRPDLIITDWMMPKLSGPELIKKLNGDPNLNSIPTILLTAKSDEESKLLGTELGATAFLGKPFSEMELLSHVANLVNLSRQQRLLVHKEEAELKIELVGNLAHRINNPLHQMLGMQGLMTSTVRKIQEKLAALLSEGEEAQAVMKNFDHDLNQITDCITRVEGCISRSYDSLEEIYNLSGIEGTNFEVIKLTDFFAKLNKRLGEIMGGEQASSIEITTNEYEDQNMVCNYHALVVAIEKIMKVILRQQSSKIKFQISASLISKENVIHITIMSTQPCAASFGAEEIRMLNLLLNPYHVSMAITDSDSKGVIVLGISTDTNIMPKQVA